MWNCDAYLCSENLTSLRQNTKNIIPFSFRKSISIWGVTVESKRLTHTADRLTIPLNVFPAVELQTITFVRFLPRCMECRRGLAMRKLSVRLSVRPSVPPSKERSLQIFTPYERSFSLVFWEEEWLVGSDPF